MVNVLIVDEDAIFCHQIKENLDQFYTIYIAHNCEDALATCHESKIELVFTTLNLPSNDLSNMISILRDKMPETRVIAISEQMSDELHISAMIRIAALGVNRILKHPVASQELHDAVDDELGSVVAFS